MVLAEFSGVMGIRNTAVVVRRILEKLCDTEPSKSRLCFSQNRYIYLIPPARWTYFPSPVWPTISSQIHLFDIDIPGKITFKESKTLTAGETPTTVDTEVGRIGIGICYDIRFQELAMIYAARGDQLICYPGAFNMTTGPLHWELLQRARAVDNQVQDLENNIVGAVSIPEDGNKVAIITAVVANVEAMINTDQKITSLKQ